MRSTEYRQLSASSNKDSIIYSIAFDPAFLQECFYRAEAEEYIHAADVPEQICIFCDKRSCDIFAMAPLSNH